MFNWDLILQFVQVLSWPAIAVFAILMFRKPLESKLEDLASLSLPGANADFRARTEAVEQQVEQLVIEQESDPSLEADPSPLTGPPTASSRHSAPSNLEDPTNAPASEPPSVDPQAGEKAADAQPDWFGALSPAAAERLDRSILGLMTEPSFEEARRVVGISSPAAILLAHGEMERALRAAWAVDHPDGHMRPLSTQQMIRELGLGRPFGEAIRELTALRNEYAHGSAAGRISQESAVTYIDTCEEVAQSARNKVLSKLRHPSRSHRALHYLDRAWQ